MTRRNWVKTIDDCRYFFSGKIHSVENPKQSGVLSVMVERVVHRGLYLCSSFSLLAGSSCSRGFSVFGSRLSIHGQECAQQFQTNTRSVPLRRDFSSLLHPLSLSTLTISFSNVLITNSNKMTCDHNEAELVSGAHQKYVR